jgi:peptidyl-prolyl cis-trans isomerase B (cyclophilin B)
VPSKDRQRVLARAKLERQMARRAEAARRRRQMQAAIGAVLALVAVVGGTAFLVHQFSGDDTDKTTAKKAEPSASASLAPGSCAYGKPKSGGKSKDVGKPPTSNVTHTGVQVATLKTNQGTLEAQLDLAKAPCTSNSFAFLAGKKYFDGTKCHRLVVKGIFVLQCGDPSATGSGGPGYEFAEENLPTGSEGAYPAGVLAMANAGPGTNGSQFFIVYKDTKLPPNYTIFGKVTKGLDVITKVAAAGVTKEQQPGQGDGEPKTPVTLDKVTVDAPKS